VASVEGENFTAEVTADVQSEAKLGMVQQLSDELDKQHRLVRSQGCERLGLGGQRLSCYRFRHILFQRYVYNSLDEAERVYLHEAVGNGLEALYEEHLEETAVQLARHFRAAGLVAKAVDYLRLAGDRARRLFANEEAIGHYTQALELIETLPDKLECVEQELIVQTALAVALTAARGYAAPEVERAYERARELCRQVGVSRAHELIGEAREFPELMGLSVYIVGGKLKTARNLAEQALRSAREQGEPVFLVLCHFCLGHTLFHLGKLEAAQANLEQCLLFYEPQNPAYVSFHLQNPKVTCLSYASWCLWHLGYPDQALEKSDDALTLARELAHPYNLAYALDWAARLHLFRREWSALQERAEAAIAFSSEHGFATLLAFGTMLRGAALAAQGENKEGIAQLREGLAAHRDTGAKVAVPYFLAHLAEAYARTGQLDKALNLMSAALAAMERTDERFGEAELYRLKGELSLMRGEEEVAVEADYRQALDVARRQEAKSLELRSATSLSRLLQKQDKPDEARQILGEVYDWFTEGFDTADLKEARALLEALA
jgi:predicted ATPase